MKNSNSYPIHNGVMGEKYISRFIEVYEQAEEGEKRLLLEDLEKWLQDRRQGNKND